MATSRTYEDSCGVAHALELVGERWALLVVRELMLGAKRFGDIKDGLPGHQRQRALAPARRAGAGRPGHPPQAARSRPRSGSTTSRRGRATSSRSCRRSGAGPPATLSTARTCTSAPTSLILSLRTNFDPSLADGVHLRAAAAGRAELLARVARKKLTIEAGELAEADATIAGDPRMFASVTYGGRPLADAVHRETWSSPATRPRRRRSCTSTRCRPPSAVSPDSPRPARSRLSSGMSGADGRSSGRSPRGRRDHGGCGCIGARRRTPARSPRP